MGRPSSSCSPSPREQEQLRRFAVDQSLETIRNRIDQFGVTEPIIQRQGEHDIVVQLPGIQDPQRAKELIGKTAVLEFKLVARQVGRARQPRSSLAARVPLHRAAPKRVHARSRRR